MKFNFSKSTIFLVFILFLLVGITTLFIRTESMLASAQTNDFNLEYNHVNCNIDYTQESNKNITYNNTLPRTTDIEAFGCHDADPNCGPGLENGYSSTYLTVGCKQWQKLPYYNLEYSNEFKYYIDESSLDSLSAIEKQKFINNVEEAVGIWNSARINNSAEPIVTLTRVHTCTPAPVCKISYGSLDGQAIGKFNRYMNTIILESNTVGNAAHELGHLIGLQDLDYDRKTYVHTSLMGYNKPSNMRIGYQDIVGAATILSNPRTCYYYRYIKNGSDYIHVCYYCDLREVRSTPITGSQQMVTASSCSHTYQKLVSADNRQWFKCTNCYKVIESEFYVTGTNNSLTITGLVDENKGTIIIPEQIAGQTVKTIGSYAFSGNKKITEVIFEGSSKVESIEDSTFAECTNLKTVSNIPNTLTRIGANAFDSCRNLTDIYIPSKVQMIGDHAFFYCDSLKNATFGYNSKLKTIGDNAFQWCTKLSNFSIPDGVTSIGSKAFSLCNNISSITIPHSVTILGSYVFESWKYSQIIYIRDRLSPASGWNNSWNTSSSAQVIWLDSSYTAGLQFTAITDINRRPIAYAVSAGTSLNNSDAIIIPDTYAGLPVSAIAGGAFRDKSGLKAISIPNSVVCIYSGAFSNCVNLTSVTFQDNSNLQLIQGASLASDGAFYGCTSLKDFLVPASVTAIGENAFSYSGLTNIAFENGSKFEFLGSLAFQGCNNLVSIKLPCSLTEIGDNAFYYCKGLKEVMFEENSKLTNIGRGSFNGCSALESIELPESVSVIQSYAFMDCGGLKYITIPSKVQTLADSTFAYCSELENVYFNQDCELTSIAYGVFSSCSNLMSIVIPKNVESIGSMAFSDCTRLNTIYYCGYSVSSWNNIAITTDNSGTDNTSLTNATRYYYSAVQPTTTGNYWRYMNNTPTSWPTVIFFISLTANGSSYDTTTTQLTLTFNQDPGSKFTTNNIIVTGATKDTLSGTGTTRTLTISNITVGNEGTVSVSLTNPTGIVFSESQKNVTVYVKTRTPGLAYTLINNGTAYEVSKGTANTNGEVTIPESYNGLPITKIKDDAFRDCTGLITVNIPSSIEAIGCEAFEHCKNLENVFFDTNSALTLIDAWAFNGCKLTNITLPNCLTTIERYAFYNSKLTGIVIPSSVTIIKNNAFYYCENLLSVAFASNSRLIDIGSYAFSCCSKLSNISIPSSVNNIGNNAFSNCKKLISITFASNSSLTNIGSYAFSYCSSLTSTIMPDSVTSIGRYAFSSCNGLTSVQIPASVKNIDNNPFAYCNELNTVLVAANNKIYKSDGNCVIRKGDNTLIFGCKNSVVPAYVTSIEYGAFQGLSGLTSISIPNGVTSIGDSSFSGCSGLTSISIPNGVTSIGDFSFSECSGLTSVTIPNKVVSIGEYAFNNCSSLTDISIPNSVTSIGNNAFCFCRSLTTITIPSSVSEIGLYAFYYCTMLTDVTISNGVESIGDAAFQNCESLTSITISASVTTIGDLVFADCYGLTAINVASSNNNYSSINGVLYNKAQTILICYPCGKSGAIVMANGISEIGNYAFSGYNMTNIVIPASVTTIGSGAFSCCYELESVTFEVGSLLTELGDEAFEGCTSLLSIKIPAGVTSLNGWLFSGCESLLYVTFEANSSLETICSNVFDSCYNLAAIRIPLGVESIQSNAFNYCTGIEEITIPSAVTYMESDVFEGWTSEQTIYINADYSIFENWDANWTGNSEAQIVWLSSTGYTGDLYYSLIQDDNGNYGYEVSVGNSLDEGNGVVIIPDVHQGLPVIRVADNGFNGCMELIKVVFVPGALLSIGEYAFSGCNNLVNINIPTTVTEIGDYAFYECYSLRNINIPESVTEIGYYSFAECHSLRSITIPSAVILIDYNALDGSYGYTIYTEADYESVDWCFLQNASDVSIFWDCTLASDKSYVVSIKVSEDNYINTDPLYPPYREGHVFAGWSTTANGLPQYTMQDIRDGDIPTNTILYAVWLSV